MIWLIQLMNEFVVVLDNVVSLMPIKTHTFVVMCLEPKVMQPQLCGLCTHVKMVCSWIQPRNMLGVKLGSPHLWACNLTYSLAFRRSSSSLIELLCQDAFVLPLSNERRSVMASSVTASGEIPTMINEYICPPAH